MNSTKLKAFGFYKFFVNLLRIIAIYMLIANVAILFIPVQSLNKWGFSVDMGFGKLNIMRSVNNGGENVLSLSDVYFSAAKENETTVKDRQGHTYTAFYNSRLNIRIPDGLANGLKIYLMMISLMLTITAFIVIQVLRRILYSVKQGASFTLKNASDLNLIARILCFAPLAYHLMNNCLMESYLSSIFDIRFTNYIGPSAFDLASLFTGLVMAILSYVLKQGVLLKQEQELTI